MRALYAAGEATFGGTRDHQPLPLNTIRLCSATLIGRAIRIRAFCMFVKRWLLITLAVLPAVAVAEPLTLAISGVKPNGKGTVIACLFHNGEHWLDMERAFACRSMLPGSSELRVEFDVPATGHFAAQVLHDENADGKPNFRIFPPKFLEGFAFSNNYKPRLKPSYSKARFEPKPGTPVLLEMTY